jgi:hypothetical protein
VSCSSTSNCFAVGSDTEGGNVGFLVEHFDGSSWGVQTFAGPPTTSFSLFNAVSCPSSSFCMAVGKYGPAGRADEPLAATYDGHGWTVQTVPLPSGVQGSASGVSCTSATFCMVVGGTDEWSWDGSSLTRQPTIGSPPVLLTSVSCLSSAFCEAVGSRLVDQSGQFVQIPYAVNYNGSSWSGLGLLAPGGRSATNPRLTGVSCVSTTDCDAAGNFDIPGASSSVAGAPGTFTFAASYDGTSWALQTTPPAYPIVAAFGSEGAVSCGNARFCWAVGGYPGVYLNGVPVEETLTDFWGGSGWELAASTEVSTTDIGLEGVSCASGSVCEAVGFYKNANGAVMPFAEQYSFTLPSLTCCSQFRPHHFSLEALGIRKRGATVTAVLKKPKTLALLVRVVKPRRSLLVGLVPLGHHKAGTSKIHWNLNVNGKLLGSGTYKVSLSSLIGGILSPPTPPGEITLIIKPNGHVHVNR